MINNYNKVEFEYMGKEGIFFRMANVYLMRIYLHMLGKIDFEKDYIKSVIKADFSCQSHQMRLEMNMNFKKNTLLEVSWIWS